MNKIDPIVRQILTDSNFDFSSITQEDVFQMLTFWRFQRAKPNDLFWVWYMLFGTGNPEMCHLMDYLTFSTPHGKSGIAEKLRPEITVPVSQEDIDRVNKIFSVLIPDTPEPLEDFDIQAAKIAHGKWPLMKGLKI
jgi:hypothetical protein